MKEETYLLPRPLTPVERREFEQQVRELRLMAVMILKPLYAVAVPTYHLRDNGKIEVLWPPHIQEAQIKMDEWLHTVIKYEIKRLV